LVLRGNVQRSGHGGFEGTAVPAFLNDPHCTDIEKGIRMVNELIDGELEYLPNFKPKAAATGA
jgi:hypothetical protein